MADIVNKALFALQRKIELENFAITIFFWVLQSCSHLRQAKFFV